MQTTVRLLYKEYGCCPRRIGWVYGAYLEQFLDLLFDQKLLGRQVAVLLAADGSDYRFGVNFVHLTKSVVAWHVFGQLTWEDISALLE